MARIFLATLLLALHASARLDTLRVGISDLESPPYLMGSGLTLAKPPGIVVELIQHAAERCQLTLRLERLPGMRLLQGLNTGELDAVGLLSYNASRGATAHYPMLHGQPDVARRLTTQHYVLYVPAASTLRWDGKRLQGLNKPVGANLGGSIIPLLERLGLPVETALGVESNFNKLAAGRLDAYATLESLGDHFLRAHPQLAIRKLQPPLETRSYYLPFSQRYAARHPAQVDCVWRELAARRDALFQQRLPVYLR